MAELLAAARARLEREGSADLSLRAVARDLGMASSAVYRYVESRDALLTLLIIEAYDSVGATAEAAAAAVASAAPTRRGPGWRSRARSAGGRSSSGTRSSSSTAPRSAATGRPTTPCGRRCGCGA